MKKFRQFFIPLLLLQSIVYCSDIKVYFSPCQKVDRLIINRLLQAKKSVYIATYTFGWSDGFETLEKLSRKGIDVKILLQFPQENVSIKITQTKIKQWDKKSCHLHAKFIVIDERYVFVGSANFTESSLMWDSNNIVFFNDGNIGKFFAKNFLLLWSGSMDCNTYKDQVVEIYFSPTTDCAQIIRNEIGKAEKNIKFAMFSFTSDSIAEEICKVGLKGVQIYGIFENSQNPASNEYEFLKRFHFFHIKKDCFVENIHDKFTIIDEKIVLTGSFNYTESARKNIETLIIIRKPDVATFYSKRWKYLWLWY
ncbi:MAG TPA: phospholipase D-like domain-containing protein [bacterium]|nr:phospholipase D-like domain-containing protein [bacterium]HOL34779.1 phospholipase D-like domain-containing protein [bacterium]HPP07762.1 phospholipase D-like domain-containing protein [bacterium]